MSRDGTRAWELRTHFSEQLDANGLDKIYPEQSDRIPAVTAMYLANFKHLVDAGSAQFLLYVKDVLSDFSTSDFSQPGRLPISLAFPAKFPSEWSPAEADGAAWAAIGDALAASTTHDRATTTQFFRSTPVKAINSSKVVLPAGLPAPVVSFVVHTVAQQLALCELLYTPSASKAAGTTCAGTRATSARSGSARSTCFSISVCLARWMRWRTSGSRPSGG